MGWLKIRHLSILIAAALLLSAGKSFALPPYEHWWDATNAPEWALFFLTIPYVLVSIGLFRATRRQSKLTEDALIADKRAFVSADGLWYFWEPVANTNLYIFRLQPRYKNTGSTPTKNLRSHVECDIRNAVLPPGHVFTDQNESVGSGMIPPHGEANGGQAPQDTPITPQDIVEAQALRRFIYLWGWIKYRDVFPNTSEHTTRFCWLIQVVGDPMTFVPNTVGQPPTPGALDFRFLQHSEGNDAD
jgi:hypothetical protein